jgi:thiol-disulfide isomerase/thioredoxin
MKRLLSLLIAICLLLATLSGCTEQPEPPDGSDNNNAAGETENNGSTDGGDDASEDEEPLPELGNSVGKLFRSISLQTLNGDIISPDDYRGKVVVVNIWATWCPPCKAELPDFDRIATEYSDEVVIIAAHDYSGRENAPHYVETNFPETNIIFAYDSYYGDAFFAAGGTKYVPMTAVLDQRGVIVYSDSGLMTYEELTGIIDGLLK